jgi:WD40 repeat protein
VNETPTDHPPAEQLHALAEGVLGETEAAVLGSHVWSCDVCLRALEQLPERTDPFLSKLRAAQAPAPAAGIREQTTALPAGGHRPANEGQRDGLPAVPGYEILDEVGRGGMGVVYRARHEGLNRLVALKMIRPGGDLEERARFKLEAEAVARLQHPNIVQIFEVGEADGRPYCALEFADGGSLAQKLAARPLPPREAARLVEALAGAMQLAHSRNIVHRDLKPANVLLTADGVPKITDFGLARHLDSDRGLTQTGAVVGTPSYMAPEQASGRRQDVGSAADVYALGAVLYECLTGRPPFQGATVLETLDQVRHQEPVPPSRLQPKTPRDLETICLKCLRKQPEQRYASAAALAEDLRRWQAGEPITARPVGRVERAVKWVRRNPVVAGLLALLLLATASGAGGIYLRYQEVQKQAEEDRERAQELQKALGERDTALGNATAEGQAKTEALENLKQEQIRVQEQLTRAEFVAYASRLREAVDRLERGRVEEARGVLQTCDPKFRGWEHAYLLRQTRKLLLDYNGHRANVHTVAFSPDGRRIVSAGDVDREGTVKVWDAWTGKKVLSFQGHANGVNSAGFSPDGKRIVTGGYENAVRVWDAETGKEVLQLKGPAAVVQSVGFSPDGKHIATGSQDRTVRLWDAESGKEVLTLRGHRQPVLGVSFSGDGQRIVSGSKDRTVRVWDAQTGKEVFALDGHRAAVTGVGFRPDGLQIASGSEDGTVRLWNARKGVEIFTLKGHAGPVTGVCFSPDGRRLASCAEVRPLGEVKVWEVETGQEVLRLTEHVDDVLCLAWSPDSKWLATGDRQQQVKVWDAQTGLRAAVLAEPNQVVESAQFSPDGKQIVSPAGHAVRVWDAVAGVAVRTIQAPRRVRTVTWSPDGKRLAGATDDVLTGGKRHEVIVWDALTGKELVSFGRPWLWVGAVSFSPDGKRIAGASNNNEAAYATVWDGETGQQMLTLKGHDLGVSSVSFSPDGKRIITGGIDKTVRVWDAQTGKEVQQLQGRSDVHSVSISRDGKRIASGGPDKTVRVWDAETGQMVLALKGHTHPIHSVSFSPDGKRIVSGAGEHGAAGEVKIWDTQTGLEALTLPGHTDVVESASFSPDGKRIVSAGWDGTVRVWDARPEPPAKR